MKYIIDDGVILSRPWDGPLAAHIAGFANWEREQGYARYSRHRQVLIAAYFSRWLGEQGVSIRQVTSGHVVRFLRCRGGHSQTRRGDAATLRQFMRFLHDQGVVPPERIAPRRLTPVEQAVQAFERYLRDERVLANATVVNYLPFVRKFLTDRFGGGPLKLSRLWARDVVGFVQRQAPRLHPKPAKLLTSALRSFLRYVRYRGDSTRDLAAAVPPVANWSMSSIPRAIPADSVRQVLASIGRRTPRGAATTRLCCCWLDWDYGRARWPLSLLMTSTGMLEV